ncbi:hypothetical protein QZH41_020139, partial [Actinostola sp. cb2023]
NVQRASDEAAREVFGDGYHGILDQVYADDDALTEAQDLLDSWVKEKTLQTIQPELDFFDEKWASNSFNHSRPKATKQEFMVRSGNHTDGFDVHDDHSHKVLSTMTELSKTHFKSIAIFQGIDYDDDLDEEIAVQQVVRNMLDKKVVKDNVLKDLGFESKNPTIDPRTKMELRHKQVKEKSETRRRDLEKTRRDKTARKEAQHLARQQLLHEEKEKQAKAKREELLMQKEMTTIRKAMEGEHKLRKEQKEMEQLLVAEAVMMARQQVQEVQKMKEQQHREEKEATEEMRRLLLNQMEERAAEETRMNLQLLQKYFSAWYSVVVHQRIKFGKARALSDWKVKLRAWNAWRAYVWHIQSDKEAEAIAAELKEKHRKDQLASKFHRKHRLRRGLHRWQLYVHQCQQERELDKQHEQNTNKMAALLQAAASGRLWSQNGKETNERDRMEGRNRSKNVRDQDGEETRDRMDGRNENRRFQNHIRKDANGRNTRNERNEELLIENVEDEDFSRPSTARQLDDMFSQGMRKTNVKVLNSSRSSVDSHPPGYQSLPGKPLENSWLKQPNKQDRNTRDTPSSGRRQNDMRKPRPKQRTLSHVDKVEDLRSKLKEQQQAKTSLPRSRSVEVFEVPTSDPRGVGSVRREDDVSDKEVDVWCDVESASSKLLSKEPKIKSEKPTTKPLLLAMEERAKLRAERKAVIDEKKRRIEEDNLTKLRLEQERKEQEFMKEKQEILKKKREEKRIVQERESEKQRRTEQLRTLNTKATEHYCRTLLMKNGISPWKQLVAMAHQNMSSAVEHHSQALVITCFYPWLQWTRENHAKKNEAADQLYRRLLVRKSWRSWRKYGQHMTRLEMVADDYADDYCAAILIKKYYHKWQDYITDEQILYWEKERQADEHNQWRLQNLALTYWKKLIPMATEERVKEKRRMEMRKRVKAWLPDFRSETESSP